MTFIQIISLFINLVCSGILLWFLYNEFNQYRMIKKAKHNIQVYSASVLLQNKIIVSTVLVYAAVISILWALFLLGYNSWIHQHWYAYMYLFFLATIVTNDKMVFSVGDEGIYYNNELIPFKEVVNHSFTSDFGDSEKKLALEIQTKNQTLRGVVHAESKAKLDDWFSFSR